MSSPWHRTKWFRILAVVVALLLVGLLAAPYLLDIDRYRDTIVEQLEKETGRDIEIEKLRLHFLPSLHLQIVNLRVKNPAGFPEGDTVAVGSVEIGLAFWPLLSRKIEISSVGVRHVQANLLTNERGQTNTQFQKKARPARKKSAAEEAPAVEVTRVGTVNISDVKVSSGTFWSRDKRIYPAWAVTGINLTVEGVDLSRPDWLRRVEASVDLSTIEASLPSLKEPLRFTDGDIAVKNNAADGDFTLGLGKLRADGTVKVADLEKPVADFTLKMKELNVAEVGALAAEKPKGGTGPGGGGGGGAGSRKLLARGTLEVGKVIIPPLSAENVKGNVRLYGDRLEVDPFTVDFYGGRTQGNIYVDLNQPSMPARVNARVQGVNVARAVAAASPEAKGKITGTFESDARLNAPLGAQDLLAALTGEGTFAVRNGTFPGMNLEGTLAGMAKFLQMDIPKGDTRFSYFGGDFRILNQRVHNRNLDLKAETLEASLGGSFGFNQTLSYTGSGLLTGKASEQQQQQQEESGGALGGLRRVFGSVARQTIGRMRVPFSVTGTFQDPKFVLAGTPTPVR